jgi:GNAT superfamily N-acetyltransferase
MGTLWTLDKLFHEPELVTHKVALPDGAYVTLRPLLPSDVDELAHFLSGLAPITRTYSIFPSYDGVTAQALCDAINRYDKLRLVVEEGSSGQIIGLLEFSFALPVGDLARYSQYRIALDERSDCRFGPTLADAFQNRGLGSKLFPYMVEIARAFGKRRIILWGGVLAENARAVRFYEKQGFQPVGQFVDNYGDLILDMILEFKKRSNEPCRTQM